jgi:dihydropteroate synthase
MGYPILLGCSRKSVIGNALNLPVDERLEGTLVTTILAAQAGYSFVRVHDVVANKRAINMLEAIKFSKN